MTAKEKAEQLVQSFYGMPSFLGCSHEASEHIAQTHALATVKEVLREIKGINSSTEGYSFWEEVMLELMNKITE